MTDEFNRRYRKGPGGTNLMPEETEYSMPSGVEFPVTREKETPLPEEYIGTKFYVEPKAEVKKKSFAKKLRKYMFLTASYGVVATTTLLPGYFDAEEQEHYQEEERDHHDHEHEHWEEPWEEPWEDPQSETYPDFPDGNFEGILVNGGELRDNAIFTYQGYAFRPGSGEVWYTEDFESPDEAEAAMDEIARELGCHLEIDHRELYYLGRRLSDGTIPVGDWDDEDDMYVANGELYHAYRYVCYAYVMEGEDEGYYREDEDRFPVLPNLDPDFEGRYSGSGEGSEEFIRMVLPGEDRYAFLELGDVWKTMGETDENGNFVNYRAETVSGASYDPDTNTLTLQNFKGRLIETNLMGNGFTINLVGDNEVDSIVVWGFLYGGSLTFTGSGSLTVNKNGEAGETGLRFNCELSESMLMIDRGPTIAIYGSEPVALWDTTRQEGLFVKNHVITSAYSIQRQERVETVGAALSDTGKTEPAGVVAAEFCGPDDPAETSRTEMVAAVVDGEEDETWRGSGEGESVLCYNIKIVADDGVLTFAPE